MKKRSAPAERKAASAVTRRAPAAGRRRRTPAVRGAAAVTGDELEALRQALADVSQRQRRASARGARRPPASDAPPGALRWNPDPEEVQKSVVQLVLTLVEFLRQLMERQAVRRMDAGTLTPAEVEAVGAALMVVEQTVRELGDRFGITPEDLNLDLGPIQLI